MNKDIIMKKLNEPNEYKNCYVAFLDMLGFKKLCYEKIFDCGMIKAVFDDIDLLINTMNENVLNIFIPESIIKEIEFGIMSDSVVISVPHDRMGLIALLYLCSRVQTMLLSNGISLRGGIAQGEFYKLNNIMFGPALVDAYILETEAINPRIVISDDIIDELKNSGVYQNKEHRTQLDLLIICDKDDSKYFVNYFNTIELISISHNAYNKKQRIESVINDGLKNEDRKVRAKYTWLSNYYCEREKASLLHFINELTKNQNNDGEKDV